MLGLHPEIILFGLGVGVLIGLTGIGGGSLMTPLLIIVLGVQPVVAVGTDLAYGAITKTLGGYRHLRKGTVDLGVSKWLAFGGVPGTLLGVLIVDRLHHTYGKSFDNVLIGCVAAALLVVASVLLVRTLLLGHLAKHERETFRFTDPHRHRRDRAGLRAGADPRPHLGRQRRADRRGDDRDLPAHPPAGGGLQRVRRGAAAVGRGSGARDQRERGLFADGQHPDRLDPRRVDRRPLRRPRARPGAAGDAGRGPARLRAGDGQHRRRAHSGAGHLRRAGRRGRARLPAAGTLAAGCVGRCHAPPPAPGPLRCSWRPGAHRHQGRR